MPQTATLLSTQLPLPHRLSLYPPLSLSMPPPPLALVTRSGSWTFSPSGKGLLEFSFFHPFFCFVSWCPVNRVFPAGCYFPSLVVLCSTSCSFLFFLVSPCDSNPHFFWSEEFKDEAWWPPALWLFCFRFGFFAFQKSVTDLFQRRPNLTKHFSVSFKKNTEKSSSHNVMFVPPASSINQGRVYLFTRDRFGSEACSSSGGLWLPPLYYQACAFAI